VGEKTMQHAELVAQIARDFELEPKKAREIVNRVTAYAWSHAGLRGTEFEIPEDMRRRLLGV
jgi:hypothetical protein